MSGQGQSFQDVIDSILSRLRLPKVTSRKVFEEKVDLELDTPLRSFASDPVDSKLNITASSIIRSDGSKLEVPPIDGLQPASVASTIDFQNAGATTGAIFNMNYPTGSTIGQFRRVAFSLNASNEIQVVFSDEAASIPVLPDP